MRKLAAFFSMASNCTFTLHPSFTPSDLGFLKRERETAVWGRGRELWQQENG